MRILEKLKMRFAMLFHRRREGERLKAELQFHLDEQIAENAAAGMTPDAARYAALRSFGNPAALHEQARETWSWGGLESLLQDVRFAMRQLWRAPGFVVITVLTLMLGIGANTAIFTLMNALLLQSLPVTDPDSLTRIVVSFNGQNANDSGAPLSFLMIQSLERHAHSFSGIFGWCDYGSELQDGDSKHEYPGAIISGNSFDVLGVRPAIGRMLNTADDQTGGGPDGWAVVISHQFWVQHYHSDPAVIGKHVTLNDYSVTIVGVAPASFEGILVTSRPDFYMPLEFEPVMRQRQGDSMLHKPISLALTTMARRKPGVSVGQASAEVSTLSRQILLDTFPPEMMRQIVLPSKIAFTALPGRSGVSYLRTQYKQPLLIMQALVGVVLLICCANLAGLGLARASARQHEFALRVALGAARMRMLRQMLVESFLLAVPGALLGLGFAWVACHFLLRLLTTQWERFPVVLSLRPDTMVLSMTVGCAVVCALLSGIAPAWIASRAAPEPALRRTGKGATRMEKGWLRRGFVCLQIALSLALVVVGGLLSTTLLKLRLGDTGFRTQNVYAVMIDLRLRHERGDALTHLYRQMVSRVSEMPGVEDASLASATPLTFLPMQDTSVVDSKTPTSGEAKQTLGFNEVGAHYFSTLGLPIVTGRDFVNNDSDADACIVSQGAAKKLFPEGSAIGGVLRQNHFAPSEGKFVPEECQIIGIVGDAKLGALREPPPAMVYRPIAQDMPNPGLMNFVIYARSMTDAENAYTKTVREFAPGTPDGQMVSMTMQMDRSVSLERMMATLSGFFAGLALLLSGIGIYGLIAWTVTQRTMEFGVRMALGATRPRILLLVLRQIAMLILIGVAAGGVAGFFSARSVKSFLYGVAPGSPWVFLSAACALCVIALLAALIPARRAVSIDPVEALRTE
jgi:predicted permease